MNDFGGLSRCARDFQNNYLNLYCRPTCCYGTICHCDSNNNQGVVPVNSTQCTDVNECNDRNGLCEQSCTNTQGSYFCSCDSGYQLGINNRECEDVNECANNPNQCPSGYLCVNTWGSYHCLLGSFASASTGTEILVTAQASTNLVGIVVALALCIVNISIIALLGARWVRMRRKQKEQDAAPAPTSAFRAEAGTVRSFNSLVSKFGQMPDPDSISTTSSYTS